MNLFVQYWKFVPVLNIAIKGEYIMNTLWKKFPENTPPKGVPIICTVENKLYDGGTSLELRYPVYYKQDLYNNEYCFEMINHEGICKFIKGYTEVIAWMEFPKPFEDTNENNYICPVLQEYCKNVNDFISIDCSEEFKIKFLDSDGAYIDYFGWEGADILDVLIPILNDIKGSEEKTVEYLIDSFDVKLCQKYEEDNFYINRIGKTYIEHI